MCKFFKTLLSLAVILVITASMFTVGVSAANDTIISFSKSKVNVGDNVSVTVTVSESKIYSVDISVSYDEKVLKYVSGASEGNNLAILGSCFQYKNRDKHIITSSLEHSSVSCAINYLKDEF